MNPAKSSNIDATGYIKDKAQLFIRFKGGGVYRYDEVPLDVYERMLDAPSIGKFIHGSIKGKYKSEKL